MFLKYHSGSDVQLRLRATDPVFYNLKRALTLILRKVTITPIVQKWKLRLREVK